MKKGQIIAKRKTGEKLYYLGKEKRNSVFEFWKVKEVATGKEYVAAKSLFIEGYESPCWHHKVSDLPLEKQFNEVINHGKFDTKATV